MPPTNPVTLKRRRTEGQMLRKPAKKIRKSKRQQQYHSSSEDENEEGDFAPVNLQDSDEEVVTQQQPKFKVTAKAKKPVKKPVKEAEEDSDAIHSDDVASDGGSEEADSGSEHSDASTTMARTKKKRNDPDVFATSMSKILSSKLSTSKRADPLLSRSKDALAVSQELADAKLEAKARHKIRQEKREALQKGRVKDVMGLHDPETSTGSLIEQEKRLRKTAQRGVIKLFNAVRAAQVKGEEALKEARQQGMVGMTKREEKVTEMSKKGFLDLLAGGGKTAAPLEG